MKIRGLIDIETEKAYLLRLDTKNTHWIPKSQIHTIHIARCEQEVDMDIPDWLYNKIKPSANFEYNWDSYNSLYDGEEFDMNDFM